MSDFSTLLAFIDISTALIALVATALLVMALKLLPPIFWPNVIEYPWKLPESASERQKDKQKTVVFAGSYNPPHFGHLAMLEYLASR